MVVDVDVVFRGTVQSPRARSACRGKRPGYIEIAHECANGLCVVCVPPSVRPSIIIVRPSDRAATGRPQATAHVRSFENRKQLICARPRRQRLACGCNCLRGPRVRGEPPHTHKAPHYSRCRWRAIRITSDTAGGLGAGRARVKVCATSRANTRAGTSAAHCRPITRPTRVNTHTHTQCVENIVPCRWQMCANNQWTRLKSTRSTDGESGCVRANSLGHAVPDRPSGSYWNVPLMVNIEITNMYDGKGFV